MQKHNQSLLSFSAIKADQSPNHTVVSFVARASELRQFASIERIGRDEEGTLSGFQRPQIAAHIREIKDYLDHSDAILPNPIVVAFTRGAKVVDETDGRCRLMVTPEAPGPGLVVDGQQRLSALLQLEEKDFPVFVSAVICSDEAELRRQFVLINNTRPLPKSLIYELLPGVTGGLPGRLSNRAFAAELTARLNYDEKSSLKGKIKQHTNPRGIIGDTAIQRVVINSLNDGMMREFLRRDGAGTAEDRCFTLISNFYRAVGLVFPEAWFESNTARTSRLVHGAGIAAVGYVMEVLALLDGARETEEFAKGLGCLVDKTAWTSGKWNFGGGDVRHWKAIQNLHRDIVTLAQYLISIVRADIRARRNGAIESDAPLLEIVANS